MTVTVEHLFVRTVGGKMIHAHDCPRLKTAKTSYPWAWATKEGWDYETILDDVVFNRLALLGLKFCRTCLPWHADMLAAHLKDETPGDGA